MSEPKIREDKLALIKKVFPARADLIEQQRCPSCTKYLKNTTPFKDDLSKKEFTLSGFCQDCQDGFFD